MEKTKILTCARCKKTLEVPESYLQKCCPSCLYQRKATYQEEKDSLPKECREFREHPNDPFIFDSHLPYCEKCKKWLELRNPKTDYSKFGENQQGWQDMTEQNDKDVLKGLGHPEQKKKNPEQEAIDEQNKLGW